jgi:hypothetical protein
VTTTTDPLERGYRRLLRWLPSDYRAAREDEMIGVLLETARPGQRRPDPADAADLIAAVAAVWGHRLWRSARLRLPLIVTATALLVTTGVALFPGEAGPQPYPGQPAGLPARFAGYSSATGSVSDAPPGRAIALYQQGSDAPQDVVLSADRDAYRQLDLAYAHRSGGDPFQTPAPALLSPDGTRVAVGYFQGKTPGLSVQDLTSGRVTTRATPASGAGWGAGAIPLAWSPHGDRIAFVATHDYDPSSTPRTAGDLGVLDLATGRVRIALRDTGVAAVAFAPDGTEMVVQDPARAALSVIGLDGTTRRTLAMPAGMGLPGPAAWSPDGRLIAVSPTKVGCPNQHDIGGTPGWCTAEETRFLDATGQHRPVPAPITAAAGRRHQLAGWSAPDRVVLVDEGDAGRTALVEVALGGGARRQLSEIPIEQGDAQLGTVQLATALLGDLRVRQPLSPDRGRWPLSWRIGAALAATALLGASLMFVSRRGRAALARRAAVATDRGA